MRFVYTITIIIFFTCPVFAGTVDTVTIYSKSMHRSIKAVVIKPDSYQTGSKRFPVVYLLHGYDGWYSNWIIRAPELKNYADSNQVIIVCPDGATNSWYFDSPVDSTYRYETYIGKEVVGFIDKQYRTIANKKHRAITGLSMGGHGALFIALRHPDVFGAAGSMSGLINLKDARNRYELGKRIGDTIIHAAEWNDWAVINLIEKHKRTRLKIIFDCGDKDNFIESNRSLHQKMLLLKIPHEYIEKPGQHNWDYWRSSIGYQLLFFRSFFNKN